MILFRPLALSVFALIVAFLLSHYVIRLPSRLADFLPLLPYVVSSIATVLALSFHRSRIALLILLLVFSYWLLRTYASTTWFAAFLPLLAILWPVNILFFVLYKERGLLTASTIIRLGVVVVQTLIVIGFIRYGGVTGAQLGHVWLPELSISASPFGQFSQLLALIAIIISYVLAVKKESWLESGIVAVLALAIAVLHFKTTGTENILLFSMMPLVLGLVILFDSYRMAYLDELTGLPGRRALQEHLGRLSGVYTLAMLDVDHFKKFNDTYGHDIGDQVLRFVAGKMRKVGGGGKAYRYGGEEFTFIFAGKGLDAAWAHLEAVREDIADSRFAIRGKGRPKELVEEKRGHKAADKYVGITASCGVCTRADGAGFDEVMAQADQALYRAKEAGRNRISK